MNIRRVQDRGRLAAFFRRDIYLHLYSLGDLDDFFWPYTTWYGLFEGDQLQAVVLLYRGGELPTLLALGNRSLQLTILLRGISEELPERCYAHLSPGLEDCFSGNWRIQGEGRHHKMALRNHQPVLEEPVHGVERLTIADQDEVVRFYRQSYPGNWFDSRMLHTGQYFGIRTKGKLVSTAGVHVYSPPYGAAALGNIATHPHFRGRGLGRRVTARCCQSLRAEVDHIGLNVKADNRPALSLYRRLGFEIQADYGEFTLQRRV